MTHTHTLHVSSTYYHLSIALELWHHFSERLYILPIRDSFRWLLASECFGVIDIKRGKKLIWQVEIWTIQPFKLDKRMSDEHGATLYSTGTHTHTYTPLRRQLKSRKYHKHFISERVRATGYTLMWGARVKHVFQT